MSEPNFSTRSEAVYQARAAHWCARTPYGLAILRYQEVGQLLRDKRLRQGSYAWPDVNHLKGNFAQFWKRSIISQEAAQHRALRSIAAPALAPDYVATLKPGFDKIAEELANNLTEQTSREFMADFSVPFAGQAICLLLGLPIEDWRDISGDASDLGLAMGVDCKLHEPTFDAACTRLMHLSDRLIAKARSGDDTLSYVARLARLFDQNGTLPEQALRDLVVISIFGGVDTTRAQLGFAIGLFIENPVQWQKLRQNLSLVPRAIEEVIRTRPTTTWATREAVEDFSFNGLAIPKGETLHMLVHSSATDPFVATNQSFDITADRKTHFGFGGGAHHCLGQLVARTDMASGLTALARRLETIKYDGDATWLPESGNTSPRHLPIRFKVKRI